MPKIAGAKRKPRPRDLVAPGTPVNRDTLNLAIERAAMSCARGPVQAAVVRDLIEFGSVRTEIFPLPGNSSCTGGRTVSRSGHAIQATSWSNMRKRLEAAGFFFVEENYPRPKLPSGRPKPLGYYEYRPVAKISLMWGAPEANN